ncbi:MAG: hypothetical protein QXN59_00690 [Candidatus Micrarchaeaceae archaeon]
MSAGRVRSVEVIYNHMNVLNSSASLSLMLRDTISIVSKELFEAGVAPENCYMLKIVYSKQYSILSKNIEQSRAETSEQMKANGITKDVEAMLDKLRELESTMVRLKTAYEDCLSSAIVDVSKVLRENQDKGSPYQKSNFAAYEFRVVLELKKELNSSAYERLKKEMELMR